MALFGAPKPPAQPEGAEERPLPIDQVVQMKQQGLSDNQIVQTLQRDGYNSQEIFDAMSQSEMKAAVEGVPAEQMETFEPEKPAAPETHQPIPAAPIPQRPRTEEIEEVAEAIIDEKWTELLKSVEKITAWKEEMDNKFVELEQKLENLKGNFDDLNKSVLGRVGEYDKAVKDVGTELKAMSTVFQKMLPGFVENVQELDRITEKLKKK